MKGQSDLPRRDPLVTAAAVAGFALLAVYVTIMVSQESTFADALPWALLMAAGAGAIAVAGRIGNRRNARWVLIGAAVVFGLLGLASLLSIGIGFLVVAVLSGAAAARMT
jgi:hypothetical protein